MGEVFGFTPSQILEFTLPQFKIYCRHSNKSSSLKLDIKSVNEYISIIFGKKEEKDPHADKGFATLTECKIDHSDKINNIWNIRDAVNSLRRKTGKKEFKMDDVIKEISKMKPSEKYRFVDHKD